MAWQLSRVEGGPAQLHTAGRGAGGRREPAGTQAAAGALSSLAARHHDRPGDSGSSAGSARLDGPLAPGSRHSVGERGRGWGWGLLKQVWLRSLWGVFGDRAAVRLHVWGPAVGRNVWSPSFVGAVRLRGLLQSSDVEVVLLAAPLAFLVVVSVPACRGPQASKPAGCCSQRVLISGCCQMCLGDGRASRIKPKGCSFVLQLVGYDVLCGPKRSRQDVCVV